MTPEQQFIHLYQAQRAAVFEQVYRLIREHYAAEELVQEVFMRVWPHRDKLAHVQKPEAWLRIITRHKALDWLAKRNNSACRP